jgi:hypothetical protein
MFESMVTRWRLQGLIRRWIEYRAAVLDMVQAAQVPPAKEAALYELQARIASDLQLVAARLGGDSRPEFSEIGALLKQHHSLGGGEARGAFQREEFERAWHSAFIFLGQLKGMPAQKGRSRPGQRPAAVPTGLERRWLPRGLGLRLWLRFVINLGVLILLLYIIGAGLGIKMAPDGRFSYVSPGSLGNVVQGSLGAFNGLWVGFFGTLATAYGVLATVLLLAALVAVVGYWVYRRA